MRKVKVTVTLERDLVEELDRLAGELGKNRSRLVTEAIRYWHRCHIERELIEGYRAMAEEDVETAEKHFSAGLEALQCARIRAAL